MGIFSRVWSVPGQVGSLPWSAVRMRRSVGSESGGEFGEVSVEVLRARRVSGGVAAVAVEGVEVDEVGHDDGVVVGAVDGVEGGSPEGGVTGGADFFGDAGVGVDVGDFADADDGAAGIR